MKTTNALVAAALAGVFAAGTATSKAAPYTGSPVASEEKEKEKCDGKDKDKCPGKEKKEEEKKALTSFSNEADKEKDKCDGKDGCKGKDKDKDKKEEKKEEKKEGEIL